MTLGFESTLLKLFHLQENTPSEVVSYKSNLHNMNLYNKRTNQNYKHMIVVECSTGKME